MMGDCWLILGASSTVARSFALEAAAHGCDLLLAGRDMEDLERTAADIRIRTGRQVETVRFDARDYDSHAAFVADCRERCTRLNVFLAFGVMPEQGDIDRDFALARATVETNYLGAVSMLSRLAPVMEAQKGGCVMVLGSVAGDRGRLKNYLYGSTKAGLHAYLQGLRARLSRAGVRVVTVKPGTLDTAMTWGMEKLPFPATPAAFAKAAWRATAKGPEVVYLPPIWRLVMLAIRNVPEAIFKKTNI